MTSARSVSKERASGFRADRTHVSLRYEGERLTIEYVVDDRPPAAIRARVPAPPDAALDLIGAAAGIYLGALTLAREVAVDRPIPAALLDDLRPIAEALYDIRRWRDDLSLTGSPTLTRRVRETVPDARPLDARRSVLLWSGGKDSTLALMTLRANGYGVHPLHASVNAGAEAPERAAIAELSPLLDVEHTDDCALEHPDFLNVSAAYADAWDAFPLSNRVPFGRDLLLAVLAVPWALHHGAGCISLGHDHECRNAMVRYLGKRIPRNDLESAEMALVLERAIQRHVNPELRLLPPVANLAELRILRDMLVEYPEMMRRTSFCFWGSNCGRCAKCLRYFLAARVYQPGLLSFEANPLAEGACPELAALLDGPDTLFQKETLFLLGRVAQRDQTGPDEPELDRFREDLLAEVAPHLDAWEAELLSERQDPQIPAGFRPLTSPAL